MWTSVAREAGFWWWPVTFLTHGPRTPFPAPHNTTRSLFAALETAHLRRAAPELRLARSHRVRRRAVGAPRRGNHVSSWWPRALVPRSGVAPHAQRTASNRRLLLAGAMAGGRYARVARLSRNQRSLLLVRSAPAAEPHIR
jgi:hypothetical protein